MALTIINEPRKARNFLVYDLEWIPGTLQLRMCGVYDGDMYRSYSSMQNFLNNELTRKNNRKWFYAHAGGLADVQFVLEELIERKGYEIKASFSGASAIIVHVRKGQLSWHFIDSYWLLRDSLKNIGKSIGVIKGHNVDGFDDFTQEQVEDWYTNAPYEDLKIYNERDCYILWKAIAEFENRIMEWGGQLKMTLASTAMDLFRRRFLKRDIETVTYINDKARRAYFASRVEVFARDCVNAHYYDINSSFPYAMTKMCPGNFTHSDTKLSDNGIYLADVEFYVPETYMPCVPTKVGGRVFFPFGMWRSWLSSVDVQLLIAEGGHLIRVWEVLHFEQFEDLRDYSLTIYDHRKSTDDPFTKIVDKLLMNSLYGKFGESAEKQTLHINPSGKVLARWEIETPILEQLFPGCWLEDVTLDIPHMHVPISVHITALARKRIFDFISLCKDVHYCDTDGFSTTEVLSDNTHGITGKELGELKREKSQQLLDDGTYEPWEYIAPKVYRHGDKVKAKGFSLSKKKDEALAQYQKLVSAGRIEVNRMKRLKELYRNQVLKPSEQVVSKALTGIITGKTISKRSMYPDGESRPWHIDELKEYYGK